ncbi:uncharacterized protein BROUX77_000851 [Berkeleyomyces rouxiae]|uniref:uncharacterized protein n=1 Tax=Berkeleyomyces rouxiae TaxID=2035830 RepID=UPI003B78D1CE
MNALGAIRRCPGGGFNASVVRYCGTKSPIQEAHRSKLLKTTLIHQVRFKSNSAEKKPLTLGTPEQQELVYRHVRKAFAGLTSSATKKGIKRSLTARKEVYKELLEDVPIDKVSQMVLEMAAAKIFRNNEIAKLYFPVLFAPSDSMPESKKNGITDSTATKQSASSVKSESSAPSTTVEQTYSPDDINSGTLSQGLNPAEIEDMIINGIKEVRPVLKAVGVNNHRESYTFLCSFQSAANNLKYIDFPPPFITVPRVPPFALPYLCQHHVMNLVQTTLEEAFFDYCKAKFPELVERNGWDSPAAVELSKWPRILNVVQPNFPDPSISRHRKENPLEIPIEVALRPLNPIRHIAVHRIHVVAKTVIGLLEYGHRIAGSLGDKDRKASISSCMGIMMSLIRPVEAEMAKIRQNAVADIEELERQRNEIIGKQREVLNRMADEYRTLKLNTAPRLTQGILKGMRIDLVVIDKIVDSLREQAVANLKNIKPNADLGMVAESKEASTCISPTTDTETKTETPEQAAGAGMVESALEAVEGELIETSLVAESSNEKQDYNGTSKSTEEEPEEQSEMSLQKTKEAQSSDDNLVSPERMSQEFTEQPVNEDVEENADISAEETPSHVSGVVSEDSKDLVGEDKALLEDEVRDKEEEEEDEEEEEEAEEEQEEEEEDDDGHVLPDQSVYRIDKASLVDMSPLERLCEIMLAQHYTAIGAVEAKDLEADRQFYTFEKNKIKAEVNKEFASQGYIPARQPVEPDYEALHESFREKHLAESMKDLDAQNTANLSPRKKKKWEAAMKGAETIARKYADKKVKKCQNEFKKELAAQAKEAKKYAKELDSLKKSVVSERLRGVRITRVMMEDYRLDAEVEKAALLLFDHLTHIIYSTNYGLINSYANDILSRPQGNPEPDTRAESETEASALAHQQITPADVSEAHHAMYAEMKAIEVEINTYSNGTSHTGEYDFVVERLELDEQENIRRKLLTEPAPSFDQQDIDDANSALSAEVGLRVPGLQQDVGLGMDMDLAIGMGIVVPSDFPESAISADRMIVSGAEVPDDLPYASIAPERIVVAPVEFEVPDNVADFKDPAEIRKSVHPPTIKADTFSVETLVDDASTPNTPQESATAENITDAIGSVVFEDEISKVAGPKAIEPEATTPEVVVLDALKPKSAQPKASKVLAEVSATSVDSTSQASKTCEMAEFEALAETCTNQAVETKVSPTVEVVELTSTDTKGTTSTIETSAKAFSESPSESETGVQAESSPAQDVPKPLLSRLSSWFRKDS